MERIDPAKLAAILIEAPWWVRLELSSGSPSECERAADHLARIVARQLDQPMAMDADPDQLALPIA